MKPEKGVQGVFLGGIHKVLLSRITLSTMY